MTTMVALSLGHPDPQSRSKLYRSRLAALLSMLGILHFKTPPNLGQSGSSFPRIVNTTVDFGTFEVQVEDP
ncbi:MAG: hypothetical protein HC924_13845 [Synechococcaceae cyanobacterium SM2_3_2]|nr:hypothetical protein [Synechococcaceae cyanobacterium SM2_3_2]